MPIGSFGSYSGTSAAAETESGGWGGGEEDIFSKGVLRKLSAVWFVCSGRYLGLGLWEVVFE